jgi:DNA-binding transcriptional ArsR family regulator
LRRPTTNEEKRMSIKTEAADSANAALEALSRVGEPMSAQQIAVEAEIEANEARAAVGLLRGAGLLERQERGGSFVYQINPSPSAFDLIKAAELGVDLSALNERGGVSAKQKQEALALSAQAPKLRELEEERKAQKVARAQEKAVARDAVSVALENLVQAAASASLGGAGGQKALVDAIETVRGQAQSALKEHQRALRGDKRGGDEQ